MYTEGKWIARISDVGIDVVEEKTGFGIVDIGNEKSLSDCEYPVEEAKANAKLISASPELLEAILNICYKSNGEWFIRYHEDACVSHIVGEAIKKATE